jgi:hypothetical protein
MHLEPMSRERAVSIRLGVTTARPGGRRQRWTVEAGHWRAEGATEKAAVDAFAERAREFLAHYREPAIESFRGYTAVLSLELGDDDNAMVFTERVVGRDGRVSYSGVGADSWDEIQARARYHLAQRTTDFHDDDSVHEAAAYLRTRPISASQYGADELYRYASWQRAARAAIDANRDDWHEWACNHWKEFPIPQPAPVTDRHAPRLRDRRRRR